MSTQLDLCLRLARAHAALIRRFDGALGGAHGISFSDFILMLHLRRAPTGKLRRVDLADRLGLTASGVTRMLLPLEKIGLVSRQSDGRDARVSYAMLTKSGKVRLDEALETAERVGTELVAERWHASEQHVVTEFLADLGGVRVPA